MKGYGDDREKVHESHATSRPLSDGYEHVGIAGELALSQLTGLAPDLSLRPAGDDGVDSLIFLRYTVNVHAARKPFNLIHEKGQKMADIMMLADYDDETQTSRLLGWEWGKVLLQAPVKDFGHGVMNHYIPRKDLRPIKELACRVMEFR